jgi:hypothetical protein
MGVHSKDRSRHQGLAQPRYNAFEEYFLVAAAFASIFDTLNFSTFATESAQGGTTASAHHGSNRRKSRRAGHKARWSNPKAT